MIVVFGDESEVSTFMFKYLFAAFNYAFQPVLHGKIMYSCGKGRFVRTVFNKFCLFCTLEWLKWDIQS